MQLSTRQPPQTITWEPDTIRNMPNVEAFPYLSTGKHLENAGRSDRHAGKALSVMLTDFR